MRCFRRKSIKRILAELIVKSRFLKVAPREEGEHLQNCMNGCGGVATNWNPICRKCEAKANSKEPDCSRRYACPCHFWISYSSAEGANCSGCYLHPNGAKGRWTPKSK